MTMLQSIFAFCLMFAAPIAMIYIVRKLWNCIYPRNKYAWYSNWEDFIWGNDNKPIRRANRNERAYQLTTGKDFPFIKDPYE